MLCKMPQDSLSFFMIMKKCQCNLMGRARECKAVVGRGVGRRGWHTEFLHVKCHQEITCILQAQVPNSSFAIKNGLQTGQSSVKN